ncbi:hypothetical protein BGZ74_000084 [Mortierella antarctica]|nr:hypothetical protein BGZ74_000084 [Mortierella antarctica]
MLQPLWGIVDGQSTSKAFSVRMIIGDHTVDDLKKHIKEARAPLYNHVPADKIRLSIVSIPDDPASELEPINLKNLSSPHRPLRATEPLWGAYGANGPPAGRIHFVIHDTAILYPRNQSVNEPMHSISKCPSRISVYDLKKAFQDAKSSMFDHIPADQIQLSQMISPRNRRPPASRITSLAPFALAKQLSKF